MDRIQTSRMLMAFEESQLYGRLKRWVIRVLKLIVGLQAGLLAKRQSSGMIIISSGRKFILHLLDKVFFLEEIHVF